jgi:hypothetical protein
MRVYTQALTLRIGEQIAAFAKPANEREQESATRVDPIRSFHMQHDRGAIAARGYR